MADYSTLDPALAEHLRTVAGCEAGEVEDGATSSAATVRHCPHIARHRYVVDLSIASKPVDDETEPLDFDSELAVLAKQADADAGAAYLQVQFGAADYDDAARRALRLVARLAWRL